MANAREYLRERKDRESLEEVESKIKKHRRKMIIRFGLAAAILALIGVITYLILSNFTYTKYAVKKSIKKTESANSSYMEFDGNVLRYSQDGVACVDYSGKELWNQTYEMQNPVLDINGSSAIIADLNGNHVYIFDSNGKQGEFETKLPIEKIRVSKQGVSAVLLKDNTVNWINCYDKSGNVISENKKSMSNSGYPIDIDISGDGKKVVVSYLHVTSGAIATKIAFYNFDSVGQEAIDNLVKVVEEPDSIYPTVRYLTDEVSFAAGDSSIYIFKGKEIPEVVSKIEVNKEIKSVFYNEQNIGVVYNTESNTQKYEMVLYNLKGNEIAKEAINTDIKDIRFAKEKIIITGNSTLVVCNAKGKVQFQQKLGGNIISAIPMNGIQKYFVVYDSTIEHIKFTIFK